MAAEQAKLLQEFIKQAQSDLDQLNAANKNSTNQSTKFNLHVHNLHVHIDKLQYYPAVLTGTLLKTAELSQLHRSNKRLKTDLQASMNDKKKASELLDIVFNKPSCKSVKEWLEKNKLSTGKSFALVRTNGQEIYFSKRQNKMIVKRTRPDISPLEAAAISGDNFLVRTLLAFVPYNQKQEAALQLQRIRNSKEYLEPFYTLQKAYKEFIEQYPILTAAHKGKKRDMLELQIGLCQRLLPTYGIQEYNDDKPFSPLPSFDKEPKRSCLYGDNSDVDLDHLGSSCILYKGLAARCAAGALWCAWRVQGRGAVRGAGVSRLDSAAISHLCEARASELDSIIKSLLNSKLEGTSPHHPKV